MGYPTMQQPNVGFATTPPPVVININQQQTTVTQQPMPTTARPQGSNDAQTFLGRFVNKITQSERYQKAAAFTEQTFKPLKEWAIDFTGALKILGKETWKGVSYGALSGLAAGAVVTVLCPPLMGPAFTACITAGITAGGITGYLCGAAKASDFYEQARQARKDEADLIEQQRQQQLHLAAQLFETQTV